MSADPAGAGLDEAQRELAEADPDDREGEATLCGRSFDGGRGRWTLRREIR